jgi:hypothetical protein
MKRRTTATLRSSAVVTAYAAREALRMIGEHLRRRRAWRA